MKSIKKAVCALLIATCLSAGMSVSATRVSVGGGSWDYGSNAAIVWSEFYHQNRDHHATVKGLFGMMTYSGKQAAGVTAKTWMKSNCGGNRAWYGFDDNK